MGRRNTCPPARTSYRLQPMDISRKNEIMLRINLLLTAIMAEPSQAVIDNFTREIAMLTGAVACVIIEPLRERTDDDSVAICAAIDALQAVEDRFKRIGRWGCTGDELATLRRVVKAFDQITSYLPWPVYQAAQEHVIQKCG